jgi:hypothetical protein
VVGLLAGPGVVWELAFGSWVLLQPERINAYAQEVIHTLRSDKHELGCIQEEQVLGGDLEYESSMQRLEGEDERFVFLTMYQTLVERGFCSREHTETATLLISPAITAASGRSWWDIRLCWWATGLPGFSTTSMTRWWCGCIIRSRSNRTNCGATRRTSKR